MVLCVCVCVCVCVCTLLRVWDTKLGCSGDRPTCVWSRVGCGKSSLFYSTPSPQFTFMTKFIIARLIADFPEICDPSCVVACVCMLRVCVIQNWAVLVTDDQHASEAGLVQKVLTLLLNTFASITIHKKCSSHVSSQTVPGSATRAPGSRAARTSAASSGAAGAARDSPASPAPEPVGGAAVQRARPVPGGHRHHYLFEIMLLHTL